MIAAIGFWGAAIGGLAILAGGLAGAGAVVAVGAAGFAFGIISFSIAAVWRARREDVALATAIGRAARDAFGLAAALLP